MYELLWNMRVKLFQKMSSIFKGIFKKSIASEVAHKGVWHSTVKQTFFSLRCGVRFKVVGNAENLAVVRLFQSEVNGSTRGEKSDNVQGFVRRSTVAVPLPYLGADSQR